MNVDAFLREHRLPDAFAGMAERYYVPLARWTERRRAARPGRTFVLGINGAQGTGKSTLSRFLRAYLESEHALRVAELSIDDIYLTRAEREALAGAVHPLLLTRGVPGTHDVPLGADVIDGLCRLGGGEHLALPRFDKSVDDRRPRESWPAVEGPVDVVVFEGWCVGSGPAPERDLADPVNELEANEDPDGTWRRYANGQLASVYPGLFGRIDALVFLRAPGFDAIRRWRREQERKLAATAGAAGSRVMGEPELERFMQHYERITRRNLETLPARADAVLSLGEDHAVTSAHYAA